MMTREQFEELLSAALDEPQRDDLREQIAAACARQPELAPLRDAWTRLDVRLRDDKLPAERINWPRLAERIRAAARATPVAAETDTDAALDELLAHHAPLPPIDWERFGRRVAACARASPDKPRTVARWLRWAPLGGLAAAAAIALMFFVARPNPPRTAPPSAAAPPGFARVLIAAPPALPAETAVAASWVAAAPADGAAPPDQLRPEPEVFLIVHSTPSAPPDDAFGLF